MIHKEEIKHKMKNLFHLDHKEDTHEERKHKAEHDGGGLKYNQLYIYQSKVLNRPSC